MIRLRFHKWITRVLQIGALVILYAVATSATCQILHSPEAHIFRFFIRVLSTL